MNPNPTDKERLAYLTYDAQHPETRRWAPNSNRGPTEIIESSAEFIRDQPHAFGDSLARRLERKEFAVIVIGDPDARQAFLRLLNETMAIEVGR
jgi:hypothetical protein